MPKITIAILIVFTSVSFNFFAQDSTIVQDFEVWGGISLEKSFLKKKLEFGLTEEFRFNNNSTQINNYFTELYGKYQLIKGLDLSLGYRFVRNNKKSGYHNEGRVFADLAYKHKLDRWSLSYRFRFQHQDEIGLARTEGDEVSTKYRLKVKVEYNIKNWKLDPYLSIEGFYAQKAYSVNYIESITESEKISGFEKLRFTLGTSYDIKKFLNLGAFYRIEQEMKSYPGFYNTPARYYIAGINLTFKI